MKYLSIIFLIWCNFLFAQTEDIYSDNFIKEKVIKMNEDKNNLIDFNYTPEFKKILKELVNISWIEKAIGVSDYYFPLFESKLKSYGLPENLKYLPVLESGLNPKAESRVGAKGLWQFMDGTGQMMGLGSNSYIDLYYCPVANTDSASRYLKSLYDIYEDWKLVLSAYNYGLGNINKKIKQVGSSSYVDIYPYLPMETRAYVPKFLVIKYLVKYRDVYFPKNKTFKYSFTDLKTVKIKQATSINKLANQYKMSANFIRFANPQLLTNIIPKGSVLYLEKEIY